MPELSEIVSEIETSEAEGAVLVTSMSSTGRNKSEFSVT